MCKHRKWQYTICGVNMSQWCWNISYGGVSCVHGTPGRALSDSSGPIRIDFPGFRLDPTRCEHSDSRFRFRGRPIRLLPISIWQPTSADFFRSGFAPALMRPSTTTYDDKYDRRRTTDVRVRRRVRRRVRARSTTKTCDERVRRRTRRGAPGEAPGGAPGGT